MRSAVYRSLLAASLTLLPALAAAQWAKLVDASHSDDAYDLAPTADGGYVVSGFTEPDDDAGRDFWVVKLGAQGEIEWQRSYGGPCPCEYAWSIRETSGGGFIVAGYTCSCARGADFWVLRLDAAGDVIWQKAYGGPEDDRAAVVRETVDADGRVDGYIVAGTTLSFGAGDRDVLLLKLDLEGAVVWQRTYGWHGVEWLGSVEQTGDGGYLMVATSTSFGDSADVWVLKLGPDGSVERQVAYQGGSAHAVKETRDASGEPDGYLVAGRSDSLDGGGRGAWLLRLALDGSIVWQKGFTGTYPGESDAILQTFDPDGVPTGFVVAGSLVAIDGGVNSNAWLMRLDPGGSRLWLAHYGGCGDQGMSAFELARAVSPTPDGGFLAAGYSQVADGGSTYRNLLLWDVSAQGAIPYCGYLSDQSEMAEVETNTVALMTNLTPGTPAVTWWATPYLPRESPGTEHAVCTGTPGLQPRPDLTVVATHPIVPVGGLATLDGLPFAQSFGELGRAQYDWDLDGDGRYDDAQGRQVSYQGQRLGTDSVGLRITPSSGPALRVSLKVPVTGVSLDAVPQSCSNQWNLADGQPLSLAIRGSQYLDVADVDVSSVTLQGLSPAKWAYQDVSGSPKPGTTCPTTADGILDLHLLFNAEAAAARLETVARRSLEDGDSAPLTITGRLANGATFQGQDVVTVTRGAGLTRLSNPATARVQ